MVQIEFDILLANIDKISYFKTFFQECTFRRKRVFNELFDFEVSINLIWQKKNSDLYCSDSALYRPHFAILGGPPPHSPVWVRITSLSFVSLERHVVVMRVSQARNTMFSHYKSHFLFIYPALPLLGLCIYRGLRLPPQTFLG